MKFRISLRAVLGVMAAGAEAARSKGSVSGGVVALALSMTTPAHALELGISDDHATLQQRNQWASEVHATWERFVVDLGQPGAADRIREIHAAGRKVILSIGGPGTNRPRGGYDFMRAVRYIQTLPRAERYTINAEPDLTGPAPCAYRDGWMKARRVLGRRLLWGDTSPHYPLRFTVRAWRCGRLPKHLEFAVHPYQPDDPLAPTAWTTRWHEGALGNLGQTERVLRRKTGIRVTWWFTEFGYGPNTAGYRIPDTQAAWLWPRAIARSEDLSAAVLVIYTARCADGRWDTRPGDQAWAAITSAI